jgi:formamidopyrimidine-DNA glycosylase
MPELLEIDMYRGLAEQVVGRRVADVVATDSWYLKGETSAELLDVLVGARVAAASRIGKVLLLGLVDDDGPTTLALRFGMTGRLLVDGVPAIERLEYDAAGNEARWDRFALEFDDGGSLVIRDPRRLGGVELDPDLSILGPDATGISRPQLRSVMAGQATLKSRLLDQSKIAGLGNLLVDEILWRSRLDPARPSGGLDDTEITRLHVTVGEVLDELSRRGGSHRGDLQEHREPGALCPRCGAALTRQTVGGRTTYSCPDEQF